MYRGFVFTAVPAIFMFAVPVNGGTNGYVIPICGPTAYDSKTSAGKLTIKLGNNIRYKCIKISGTGVINHVIY